MSYEEAVINIIANGGEGRSHAMNAIRLAKEGDFQAAEEALKLAEQALVKGHRVQSNLLKEEASGTKNEVTILMVHAQDHLMNAMTVLDLAKEIIFIHQHGVQAKAQS